MKVTIIGGGNMGAAIASGFASGKYFDANDICVVSATQKTADKIRQHNKNINAVAKDYESMQYADIVILAIKPWLIESFIQEHKREFNTKQIIISVAAGVSLEQLTNYLSTEYTIYKLIPNTAIAVKQSMTLVASHNSNEQQDELVTNIFNELGKTEFISENLMSAATSLTSCGIAFAFRYIRAAMEGGVEMGLYPNQSKEMVLQTLRGAIEVLESTNNHPEAEIDRVTTAGGITIKGLNEMEHAGFTSAVIKGLKASNI